MKKILAAIAAVAGLLLAALTVFASKSKHERFNRATLSAPVRPGSAEANVAESPGFSPRLSQALSNVSISRGRAVSLATIAIVVLVIGSAAAHAGV
jgi:hypothetical protein